MTAVASPSAALNGRTLTVSGLGCVRGDLPLFSGLTFSLSAGEALVLRGANGAGKSSLLLCLAGLLPHEGDVVWSGRDPDDRPGADIHLVGHLPALKPGLSLAENLTFWAELNGGDAALVEPSLAAARLSHAADLDAGLLSAGQTRRLSLCRLLVAPRPIWLLDEPTSALDAQGDQWVAELIDAHLDAGGLAVIASHLPLGLRHTPTVLTLGAAE